MGETPLPPTLPYRPGSPCPDGYAPDWVGEGRGGEQVCMRIPSSLPPPNATTLRGERPLVMAPALPPAVASAPSTATPERAASWPSFLLGAALGATLGVVVGYGWSRRA